MMRPLSSVVQPFEKSHSRQHHRSAVPDLAASVGSTCLALWTKSVTHADHKGSPGGFRTRFLLTSSIQMHLGRRWVLVEKTGRT